MNRVLDPRTKLLLLIFAAGYMGVQLSFTAEILLILIYTAPFFIVGLYKWSVTFLLIYSFQLLLWHYLVPQMNSGWILFILSYLTYGLRMLLPSMIAGAYSMKTTAVNEWIGAMKKMNIPNWLLIPWAVVIRFFPTIYEDYRHIRKALAFRGVGTSFWDLANKPVRTVEYIFIPLLMNAAQVAEDLTISSLTKGLGLSGKQTTITKLRMTAYDWIAIFLAAIPFILYVTGEKP